MPNYSSLLTNKRYIIPNKIHRVFTRYDSRVPQSRENVISFALSRHHTMFHNFTASRNSCSQDFQQHEIPDSMHNMHLIPERLEIYVSLNYSMLPVRLTIVGYMQEIKRRSEVRVATQKIERHVLLWHIWYSSDRRSGTQGWQLLKQSNPCWFHPCCKKSRGSFRPEEDPRNPRFPRTTITSVSLVYETPNENSDLRESGEIYLILILSTLHRFSEK